jgi:hypothetical protein
LNFRRARDPSPAANPATSTPVGTTAMGDVTPRFLISLAMLSLGAMTPSQRLANWVERLIANLL